MTKIFRPDDAETRNRGYSMQEYFGSARIMHAILDDKAQRLGSKAFVRFKDDSLTYGELKEQSERIATYLADELGVRKGGNVGVFLPNRLEWLPIQFGISRTGAVMAALNTVHEKDVLVTYLNNIGCSIVFVDASLYQRLYDVRDELKHLRTLIWVGHGSETAPGGFEVIRYDTLLDHPIRALNIEVRIADPVDIFSTSGSTGVSKGVVLPHNHHYIFGKSIANAGRMGPDDVMYIMLPLCHGAGSFMSIMPSLLSDASIYISEGFSARNWLDDIRRASATVIWTVNSIAPILMKQPERPDDNNNPLRAYFTIGILPELIEPFEERFGVKLLDCFGSTESGHIAYSIWEERRLGSVGPVNSQDYDVRVVDDFDQEVPPGEVGECVSRNKHPYSQMLGYYGMPAETLEMIGNRWMHSGDLVRIDKDGWLYFAGRKKDMIRRRGENISCHELETLLARFEEVVECAAIGVPSEIGEEEVKVVIVPRSADLKYSSVMAHCQKHLPKFMWPRYAEFVSELPKLPNQKLDKVQLRAKGLNKATWDIEKEAFAVGS
jgi:crotonobetaine/carnitine-CoA ligase